jgi:hypothetical protein
MKKISKREMAIACNHIATVENKLVHALVTISKQEKQKHKQQKGVVM